MAVLRKEKIQKAFAALWELLFTTPVHLDSALSKQPKELKSILARIVPPILLRPAAQAQALGVGLPLGEPWGKPELAKWRPAVLMADRLYEMMSAGIAAPDPIREDFPEAMVAEWEKDWGPECAARLVDALGREAPLSLRARAKLGAAELVKRLSAGHSIPVRIERSRIAPLGVRLAGYAPVLNTKLFEEGAFEIQDEGSQVMALFALWPEAFSSALAPTPAPETVPGAASSLPPGKKVLTLIDACAGAGGKTLAMADAVGGGGRVFAYDTSEKKLQALRRRATHAGFNNIRAIALEEGKEPEALASFRATADVVLVDAPCSGWGVLRRNPDIKWRQSAEQIKRMPEIQSRVLATYAPLAKAGGHVVYGVCTFRRAETIAVIDRFLAEHPEFEPGPGGFLGPGSSDGFFMQALLRKK